MSGCADDAGQPGDPPGSSVGRPSSPALAEALDAPPTPPPNARVLADGLRAAERAVRDPGTPTEVLAAAAHVQQVAYRRLGQRPGWDDEVLRRLPHDLRAAARANVDSRRAFLSMQVTLSDTLPAWRIVRPEPPVRLLRHYREAERRFGVDWEYLAAINLVETAMGRIAGTSVAGARGPMQFIPATWAQYGRGDVDDPHDAIQGAARYLAARGFTDPGGRPGALYAYNNHPAYVRGVTRLAEVMQQDARAFHGYYHWQVYYRTVVGDVLLPEGYAEQEPVAVRRWLRRQGLAVPRPGSSADGE